MLTENGLGHQRIQPHCPEENGLIERANRTLRESLEEEEPSNLVEAEATMSRIVRRYNQTRLHSAFNNASKKKKNFFFLLLVKFITCMLRRSRLHGSGQAPCGRSHGGRRTGRGGAGQGGQGQEEAPGGTGRGGRVRLEQAQRRQPPAGAARGGATGLDSDWVRPGRQRPPETHLDTAALCALRSWIWAHGSVSRRWRGWIRGALAQLS